MLQGLREAQAEIAATFVESGTTQVPDSFGNDAIAIAAARQGVAVCDRSHWGLIQVADADRIRYLHNQSTNDFYRLKPGEGCDTVFVTSTARTLDLATAYVLEDSVLLIVSPNRCQQLMTWLDRYIFPADRVELANLTDRFGILTLIGPESQALLKSLGVTLPADSYASHELITLADAEVRIATGTGLAIPGYTLIIPAETAASVWRTLIAAGAVPAGDRVWEQLRVEQGRPMPDRELTEDYNPLEAGLWQAISLSKGCYIGQETIARLNTYQGVKQLLWGIQLSAPAAPGSLITIGEEKVGKLTSITKTTQGLLGLAYIRTKAGGAGLKVKVHAEAEAQAPVEGEIKKVPFLTHQVQQS